MPELHIADPEHWRRRAAVTRARAAGEPPEIARALLRIAVTYDHLEAFGRGIESRKAMHVEPKPDGEDPA